MSRENDYIRFDWAMKHMLRDKENFEILEGLVRVLIGDDIEIEEILESESNQDSADDKFNRVDIKARNSKGHIILVEVQLTSQLHYLERILYGVCKTITDHMSLGKEYENVKKVYSISILYGNFGQGDDYVYHGTTEFVGIHSGKELIIRTREKGKFLEHFPKEVFPEYYILRVKSFDKLPESSLDEWMEYLKTGRVKDDTDAPGLQAVRKKLKYLNMSKEERRQYERHIDNVIYQDDVFAKARQEGIEIGEARGRAEGKAEGAEEEKYIMVKGLIDMGMSIDKISQVARVSEDEIRKHFNLKC